MSIQKINSNTLADGAVLNSIASSVNFRNRIINGDMRIDQRNAGASVTLTASNVYNLDRWYARAATGSGTTAIQSTTVPPNYKNSLLITVGTGASPGTTDNNYIAQRIEGLNMADFGWGTATATTVTLSFWVRSSLGPGTFGGAIQNADLTRSYPFTYTISAANTWEQKSVTIVGDTSGTWLTTNGIGASMTFDLGTGATFQGTAGSWASADYRAATGAVSVVGTSGATFYITGVQLEAGSVATPFERRPYGTELALCQRYLNVLRGVSSTQLPVCPGFMRSATNFVGIFKFPVTMRTAPSLTSSNSTNHFHISPGNGDFDGPTVGLEGGAYVSPDVIALTMNATTGSSTIGLGATLYLNATTSAFLFFVAEL
jgi:hypothetical protein